MVQLHTIRAPHRGRNRRRVGRGGKRGTYSGRGMKGQKSRSGARIRPAIRDLIKKLPKLRGTSGSGASGRTNPTVTTITLTQLGHAFESGASVSMKTLQAANLVASKTVPAKIVGTGKAPKKINVVGVPVSAAAKTLIEDAGGTVKV